MTKHCEQRSFALSLFKGQASRQEREFEYYYFRFSIQKSVVDTQKNLHIDRF